MVKILLNIGKAGIDSKDNGGRTPLWWTAGVEYEGMVKGASRQSRSTQGKNGRRILWWAAGNGHDAVTKMLLGIANIDAAVEDVRGLTV